MIQAVKNDEKNQLLAPSNTHRVRDLIKKSNDAINKQENNDPKFRSIPMHLSKRLENGEDKEGQDLLDFIVDDMEKMEKKVQKLQIKICKH